jgi:hypothetical protein
MGAPSPDLSNLWLARAFNAQDVEAAAALYHPDAAIVQVDQVHGGTTIARGAEAIRATMAAYINLKPHMDVVTHHVTVAGDFAMTRSQCDPADGLVTDPVNSPPAPSESEHPAVPLALVRPSSRLP